MTNTRTFHIMGSTGVAACGQRLGNVPEHRHIGKTATGLLEHARRYGAGRVCPGCTSIAAEALRRRGWTLEERFWGTGER